MKRSLILLAVLVLLLFLTVEDPGYAGGSKPGKASFTIRDPYAGPWGPWYRGQVHAHSTIHMLFINAEFLREKVEKYRDAGFDFVSITDHNFTHIVPDSPHAVLPTLDPGVEGIHFISGVEVGFTLDAPEEGPRRKQHIGGLGCDWTVAKGESLFHLAETDTHTAQAAIDSIRTLRYAEGKEALAILNHPEMEARYDVRFYPHNLQTLTGQSGIEVYNTKWARSRTRSKTWQNHGAAHWDYVIRHLEGRRWGFATDDAHHYEVGFDYLGGWISVQAPVLTTEAILDAVSAGRFIACVDSCAGAAADTASAAFTELGVRGEEIVAASDRPSEFTWWTDCGHLVRERSGVASDAYRVEGWERAVRVRLRNSAGAAYSQPFFVENEKRDEDRWRLRPEKRTRLLLHFDEGTGPLVADATEGGGDLLISPPVIPPHDEWQVLADTVAYRDSLWGGWMHNGVGTVPDETDVDRDRDGYALRAHGSSLSARIPLHRGSRLLFDGSFTVELVGTITRRTWEEQPLLVNESRDETGRRTGWRLVVTGQTDAAPYRFTCYDEDGQAHTLAFGEGLATGETHLIGVVLEKTRRGAIARGLAGGQVLAESAWEGMRPAWRELGNATEPVPVTLFADPFRPGTECFFNLRELRVTEDVRSPEAFRGDAERLLLTL